MSRADQARREAADLERDRLAHERPNVPPGPVGAADSWEGFCAGNRTSSHGWPTAKTADRWRCGSCGRWLNAPTRTRTCNHKFDNTRGPMCVRCGAVP